MNNYLRQQAEVLLAMSRETIDLGMAGRLRKLAADFHERASALERRSQRDIGIIEPNNCDWGASDCV